MTPSDTSRLQPVNPSPVPTGDDEPGWVRATRESERRDTIRRRGVALVQYLRDRTSPMRQQRFNELVASLPRHDPALDHLAIDGRTPLTTAAAEGSADQVQRLLDAGASANAPDRNGWTALHHAVHRLDLDIVRRLIAMGADVATRVPQGSTPQARTALHLLVARASGFSTQADLPDVAIANALRNAGCDPAGADARGRTPLQALQRQNVCARPALLGWFEVLELGRTLDHAQPPAWPETVRPRL